MNHLAKQVQVVGQYRRFGPVGPVYQVAALGRVDEIGEQWLDTELVESGEHVEYKLNDALDDPFEA